MDAVPGLSDLPAKIFTQCVLLSSLLTFAFAWLGWQLAKTRAAWEADRSEMSKVREADKQAMFRIIEAGDDAYKNLAVSHAKLEGMLLAAQARSNRDG